MKQEKILSLINSEGPISAHDIHQKIDISRQMLHRHLKKMVEDNRVIKMGMPPKVYYARKPALKPVVLSSVFTKEEERFLYQHFWALTPTGEIQTGPQGFHRWCLSRDKSTPEEYQTYQKTLQKYTSFSTPLGIPAKEKLIQTLGECVLSQVYYQDFYAIEIYGKTKLGSMTLHGKNTSDKNIIQSLAKIITPTIETIIKEKNIQAIGLIPHSIKRPIQFLPSIFEKTNIPLPRIPLQKIYAGQIAIAQKSLKKPEERIENARETIHVKRTPFYKNILLIDDACGSGATLNETAKKILSAGIAEKVYGFCIVGSFKGFEVINEV